MSPSKFVLPRPSDPASKAWRWRICLLLFAASVLSYLDRQTVAICAPAITDEFHLSNQQFGWLLAAFRWTYAAAQVPAGWLADRFAVRGVYAAALAFWSFSGMAAAWAFGVSGLAAARGLLGVGEAFNTPCALRVTRDVLPQEDRGLGNGIFNSGSAAGALLAPLIIGPIAQSRGWRAAFVAVGMAGAVWVALWLGQTAKSKAYAANLPAPAPRPGREAPGGGEQRRPFGAELRTLLRLPGFWVLAAISVTLNPAWYFCADWIPKYMHDQRGFVLLAAGMVTTPIFLGADLGGLANGFAVKFFVARGRGLRRARALCSVAAMAIIVPAAATGYVHSWLGIALLAVAAFGMMALMVNYLGCVQELRPGSTGLVAGLLGAIGNAAGAALNPLIGRYVDETGNYNLVFVVLVLFSAISFGAILLFNARFGPADPEPVVQG